MPKAYSYIRFSSLQQAQGDSFRRQSELTLKACEKYNLDLDTELTFEDLGVSGFKGDHVSKGALGKFIQLVEEGNIVPGSWLIVESLDRLSREDLQTATLRYLELLNNGITIYTCQDDTKHEPTSGVEATTKMMYSIMVMGRANEESATKSIRGKASWSNKRKLASNGTVVTKMIPSWLTVVDGNIEIVEDKAKTVRLIFDCNINGMGTSAIASHFNKEQISHISNKKNSSTWHDSYIDKILNNPAVYGSFQMHQGRGKHRVAVGEPIENYYPKVIDKATFLRAKSARASRKLSNNQGRKGDKFSNLLQGLVRCKCGATMRYSDKGRNLVYLQCSNKVTGKSNCNTANYRYDYVESSALYAVQNYDTQTLISKLSQEQAKKEREAEDERLLIEAKINEIKAKIDNLVDIVSETGNRSLTEKIVELETQEETETKKLQELPQATLENSVKKNEAMKLIAKVALGAGTYEERVRLNVYMKSIISHILFGDNKEYAFMVFKDGDVKSLMVNESAKQAMQDFQNDPTILDDVISFEDVGEIYFNSLKKL